MRWWSESESEIHLKAVQAFRAIDNRQSNRRTRNAINMGRYENRTDITSLDGADWAQTQMFVSDTESEASNENVYKAAVDSAVAKISTVRPRLIQVTNGADFALQSKAKKRTLMIEGVIHEQKAYKKSRMIFKDAAIWDNGLTAVYADFERKKVIIERVLDDEVAVDDLDGKYGNPRSLFRHKLVSRSEIKSAYPDKKLNYAIDQAGRMRGGVASEAIDDPVSVLEAWHLPSGPKATDGRHIICLDKGALVDEPWMRERFPLAVFRWKERQLGWRGMGIIEDIHPLHKQLNFYDKRIERLLNASVIRAFVEKGSNVNPDDLSNDDSGFVFCEYSGNPPQLNHDPGPSPELFMERERIKRSIYEHLGLSQLFAESKKPAGLTAGVAIREAKDIESERFTDVYQAWDDFWIDVGELILDALEDLVEHPEAKDIVIQVPTGGDLESIKLSDIDMDRQRYKIQIRPASLLPKEPAGRIAKIHEMAGMFPEAGSFLYGKIDSPDVDDVTSLLSAGGDAIRYDIDKLSEGEFITPEPFLDLGTAKMLVLAAYQRARNGKAEQKILDAFRNYLLGIQNILDDQMAMMAPPPGMPSGLPLPPGLPPGGGPPAMPG